MEEVEDVQIGQKRKRKDKNNRVSIRSFLDDEAELSGDGSDDDVERDVEGLIDDSSDVEDDNESYFTTNDESHQPGPSSSASSFSILTDEECKVEMKHLKRVKAFLSKLKTYISQITILRFN